MGTGGAESLAIVGTMGTVLETSLNWERQRQLEMSGDESIISQLDRTRGSGTRSKTGKVYNLSIICHYFDVTNLMYLTALVEILCPGQIR